MDYPEYPQIQISFTALVNFGEMEDARSFLAKLKGERGGTLGHVTRARISRPNIKKISGRALISLHISPSYCQRIIFAAPEFN